MSQITTQLTQDAVDSGILLGAGSRSSVYLRNGILDGTERNYITKIWNVWDHSHWHNFYTELYVYAHPKLLRPLQGICVPHVIGIYGAPGGRVSFDMDLPHAVGWRTASPAISAEAKEAIIEAYTMIHAQGIEHGDVAYRHILIGGDSKVTIIDFSKSKCILGPNREEGPELIETTPESLAREMRKVMFLLDYGTARRTEYARAIGNAAEVPANDIRRDEYDGSPFTLLELEEWEVEGDCDMRFEVRPNGRSASCPKGSKVELFGKRYDPQTFELNAGPCTSAAMQASVSLAKDDAKRSSKRVSTNKKHSRDTSEDDRPTAKRAKVVQFHPDTNDNGLWATGRPLKKIRRKPTPFIHETEFVESPSPDSGGAVDIVEWGDAGPPRSSAKSGLPGVFTPLPTSSPPSMTHSMVEFPPMCIVLIAGTKEPKMWQVSEDVFHDVATYIKLRTKRLPVDVSTERSVTRM